MVVHVNRSRSRSYRRRRQADSKKRMSMSTAASVSASMSTTHCSSGTHVQQSPVIHVPSQSYDGCWRLPPLRSDLAPPLLDVLKPLSRKFQITFRSRIEIFAGYFRVDGFVKTQGCFCFLSDVDDHRSVGTFIKLRSSVPWQDSRLG